MSWNLLSDRPDEGLLQDYCHSLNIIILEK